MLPTASAALASPDQRWEGKLGGCHPQPYTPRQPLTPPGSPSCLRRPLLPSRGSLVPVPLRDACLEATSGSQVPSPTCLSWAVPSVVAKWIWTGAPTPHSSLAPSLFSYSKDFPNSSRPAPPPPPKSVPCLLKPGGHLQDLSAADVTHSPFPRASHMKPHAYPHPRQALPKTLHTLLLLPSLACLSHRCWFSRPLPGNLPLCTQSVL